MLFPTLPKIPNPPPWICSFGQKVRAVLAPLWGRFAAQGRGVGGNKVGIGYCWELAPRSLRPRKAALGNSSSKLPAQTATPTTNSRQILNFRFQILQNAHDSQLKIQRQNVAQWLQHKILEWFRLEGSLKIVLLQPLPWAGHFPCPRFLSIAKVTMQWILQGKQGGL